MLEFLKRKRKIDSCKFEESTLTLLAEAKFKIEIVYYLVILSKMKEK